MKNYSFLINARLKHAIGITYLHRVHVKAEDYTAAALKLYETHEHISILDCQEHNNRETLCQWADGEEL